MTDSIEFVKLSGSGNDFICIDSRDGRYDEILAAPGRVGHFARSLCSRGMGVGADGVVFACQPDIEGVADVAARFFEADGSEAELCGNGTACFIHWVIRAGWVDGPEAKILTSAGVVRGANSDGPYVRVCIPDPEDLQFDLELEVLDAPWECDFAVVGVPHLVTYVDDVSELEVAHWGPALRHHERFQPRGVNVNFVHVIGEGELALRTWEFGVEGETLACGTGSAAAAILAARRFGWPAPELAGGHPILIQAHSRDVLRIYFNLHDDGTAGDVCLETVVRFLCRGKVHPDLTAAALSPPAKAGLSCGQHR